MDHKIDKKEQIEKIGEAHSPHGRTPKDDDYIGRDPNKKEYAPHTLDVLDGC
jgi:hypothetical protein